MSNFTKPVVFTGAAVAIVTPFTNNKVNYDQLGKIIEYQIANSTDAIVICGTTGESSTLTDEEHRECIRYVVEKVAGRVPVIAGTGSNDTDYAIDLSKYACEVGSDALLLVTPYYNKATPKGMVKNFLAVAEATNKPIILYNVPSRTGCSITLPVYKELAKHERIVATKEASGNISAIAEIAAECGDSLSIYSGNDDQIVPIMSLGAKGVISVLSNVMPKETHDICALYEAGKVNESAALQLKLLDLINSLFCEVNPIPVKTAMSLLGWCSDEMRLPLCEMEEANKARLIKSMRAAGLNV
nr:4-hydroxy-tetrahydrodipicolinate synthase [Clostridia bacterium]